MKRQQQVSLGRPVKSVMVQNSREGNSVPVSLQKNVQQLPVPVFLLGLPVVSQKDSHVSRKDS